MSVPHVPSSRRAEWNDFIARNATAWELSMAALAVISVVVGLVATQASEPLVFLAIEWVLTVVFCAEYSLRLWASPIRAHYFRNHLIDLISIIPPARGARLLRLLRLLRVASDLSRVLASSHLSDQRKLLGKVALFWLAVVAISSLGMYLAESDVNPNVKSIFDALWWAIVTITTVGYGDVSPVTAEGRLAAGVLMVLGIVLFSTLTAAITSTLTSSSEVHKSVNERLNDLEELRLQSKVSAQEYTEARAKILREL